MNNKFLNGYFFILFSLIPVSIIVGSAISLINILLIDFSFIFFLIFKKEYKFLSHKTIKLILILYLYLIINTFISQDFSTAAPRNLGFIRFIIMFCALNYFFYNNDFFIKIIIVWSIIITLVTADTYFESFFGKNILGYGEIYGNRIVSFFKDEPIVGGYINSFYLIIIGYLFTLKKNTEKYKNFIFVFSIFFLFAILLTGERSNTIRAFLSFLLFYSFIDCFKLKKKIIFILLSMIFIGFLINQSNFLQLRYGGQVLKPIITQLKSAQEMSVNEKRSIKEFKGNLYFKLYISGFNVFKNYPFFGVGNKNYRVEACVEKKNSTYVCNTHPHQIYLEFLAEHGIIGSFILLLVMFKLIFGKLRLILDSKNYIQIACFVFLTISFIPLLPSGAFFSDYMATLFWLNLSLMYAVGKKTNIYSSN
jgi:O-antigen ligase